MRVAAPLHAKGAVDFVALEDVAPDETFRLRPDGDVSVLATSMGRLGQFVPVELRPWPGAETDRPRWQVVAGFRRLAAVRLLARERVLARLHTALSDEDAWGLALADALLQQPLSGAELRALRERLLSTGLAPWAGELVEEALVRAPVEEDVRERFYDFLRQEAAGAGTIGEQEAKEPPSVVPAVAGPAVPPSPAPGSATAVEAAIPAEAANDAATPTEPAAAVGTAAASSALAASPGAGGEAAHEAIEITCDELARDLVARFSQLDHDLALLYENWADVSPEERRALVEQARYVAELLPFMEVGE